MLFRCRHRGPDIWYNSKYIRWWMDSILLWKLNVTSLPSLTLHISWHGQMALRWSQWKYFHFQWCSKSSIVDYFSCNTIPNSERTEDIMNVNKVSRTSGHLARFRFLPQVAKTQVTLDICDLAEWQLVAAGAAELICWSYGAQIKTADTYNQDFHQEMICPQNILKENYELITIKVLCRF